MDYWLEHAEIALSEAGLPSATKDQLQVIAGVIESAHDFYGQSMGHDVSNRNFHAEKERQHKDELAQIEKQKDIEIDKAHKALKQSREERERMKWVMSDLRRELSQAKAKI